jgi:ribosome biogenesis GTPase
MKNRYDEGDARIRAPRSKPRRSKDRPDYSQLPEGYVVTVDRGRITTILKDGTTVIAMKARELGKNSVVVGDFVKLDGDFSGKTDTLARAVLVLPRRNTLSRTIDDIGAQEKVLAANIDQLIIVVAAANPEPRHGFVDRCLAVAYDQGIKPILVITKADLANPIEFIADYEPLDIEIYRSALPKEVRGSDASSVNLLGIREALRGKRSVLIGHSGVGKSTLVNAITQIEHRSIGDVNLATGRGRHTSSSAFAFELTNSGWIIDTPGVRSFGLEHIDRNRIINSFADLGDLIKTCPKNCSHDEAGCALNSSKEIGTQRRISGLRRILKASER